MNRKHYDTRIISVFDHIGSFFVDTFYNSLYLKACDAVKMGQAKSITDAYRSNVLRYVYGITHRTDLYMTVVKKLHEYYQKCSGGSVIIFSDFEDKVLSQFIPLEFYKDFTEKNKDEALHRIIINSVNDFGMIVLGRVMLARIIDDHKNPDNVHTLQDRMVDIFIARREDYYERFVKEVYNKGAKNQISMELFNKIKLELTNEKKKTHELKNDNKRALSMISQLAEKIKNLTKENEYLKQSYTSNEEIETLRTKLNDEKLITLNKTKEINSLNNKVYDMQYELNEIKYLLDEKTKEYDNLRKELISKNQTIVNLRDQIQNMQTAPKNEQQFTSSELPTFSNDTSDCTQIDVPNGTQMNTNNSLMDLVHKNAVQFEETDNDYDNQSDNDSNQDDDEIRRMLLSE